VVKIQGAGDNAFSTGANLNGFKNLDHDGLASWIKLGNKLFNDVESLPIPTLSSTDMY
jgi:enoyl-CoA hydratase/carnithine racemase